LWDIRETRHLEEPLAGKEFVKQTTEAPDVNFVIDVTLKNNFGHSESCRRDTFFSSGWIVEHEC
jgi:hypothetical protein